MNRQPATVTAADVAEYILRTRGPIRSPKLQKLVYYSQAWSLVWSEAPLFSDRIEAWRGGPVVPELYKRHEHQFLVETVGGAPDVLSDVQRKTIDSVLLYYGPHTSEWLSQLTHLEKPWIQARGGLPPEAHGNEEITLQAMADFYEEQPCGGPRGEVDLSVVDLGRLLKAEAEVRACEVVAWDDFERELRDQARTLGRTADQGTA